MALAPRIFSAAIVSFDQVTCVQFASMAFPTITGMVTLKITPATMQAMPMINEAL